MISDNELEDKIDKKVHPKVKPQDIDDVIKSHKWYHNDELTVCKITLVNDYTVSAVNHGSVDPRNFDRDIGEKLSYDEAKKKIWPLLGFELANAMQKD